MREILTLEAATLLPLLGLEGVQRALGTRFAGPTGKGGRKKGAKRKIRNEKKRAAKLARRKNRH